MPDARRYPRVARVKEVIREVLADALERLDDDRLGLITVTDVIVEPDLRHATVLLSSMSEPATEALEENRVRLQAAIGRQLRLKRTPLLAFQVDPAVTSGETVERILRNLHRDED